MKKILSLFALLLLSHGAFAQGLNLLPLPTRVERGTGSFELQASTPIRVAQSEHRRLGDVLADCLAPATGWDFSVEVGEPVNGAISIDVRADEANPESYQLTVTRERILIRAGGPAGAFYGIQTLRQLFPAQIFSATPVAGVNWSAPAVDIHDVPRFKWRGMMLDSSRHFKNTESVKRYIDNMATHKLNTFHWHLVDDHGWRIEIKKYPKLTSVGGFRHQPPIGRHGGFHTQKEIREIVQYAADRFVTVVPEIEMPGHSMSATASYPELACQGKGGKEVNYFTHYPLHKKGFPHVEGSNVLCAGKESTYSFYEDVLMEVMALFPSRYIHLGGDEVKKSFWQKCPDCKKQVQKHRLKDMHALQNYMMNRMSAFLNENGRVMVGWDEILQKDLSKESVIMSWRGEKGGITGAKAGYDVVMSPNTYLYLNWGASVHPGHPPHWPRTCTLQSTYGFDPVPAALNPQQAKRILGCQGNLWSEFTSNDVGLDLRVWPRGCALAEMAWTPQDQRNLPSFLKRLKVHEQRLDELGISYWQEPEERTMGNLRGGGKQTWKVDMPLEGDRTYFCTLWGQPAKAKKGPKGKKGGGAAKIKSAQLTNGSLVLTGRPTLKGSANTKAFTLPLNAPKQGWSLSVEAAGPASARVTLYDAFAWKKAFEPLDCAATRRVAPVAPAKPMPAAGSAQVLLLGDDFLANEAIGQGVLDGRTALNLAAAGDRTQNVLWRLQQGALDGLQAKRVVLSVGMQNLLAGDSPEQVLSGVAAIVDDLHRRLPNARILILGLTPTSVDTPYYYESVNNALSSVLDERHYVRFYNLNYALLKKDGTPDQGLFAAPGRLNAKGYQAVATELKPVL